MTQRRFKILQNRTW